MLGGSDSDVALALACFGGGSMAAALLLPRLLDHIEDRTVMLFAATLLGLVLLGFTAVVFLSPTNPSTDSPIWPALLVTWIILGVGYSAVMTPSGRLLRRSAHAADRPAVFAAQFALSHACWLLTYPLAGWFGSFAGMVLTLTALAVLTFIGVALATKLWPAKDPEILPHEHPGLPAGHPHLHGSGHAHAHSYVVDDLHHRWP